jgi:hypothetical protein
MEVVFMQLRHRIAAIAAAKAQANQQLVATVIRVSAP